MDEAHSIAILHVHMPFFRSFVKINETRTITSGTFQVTVIVHDDGRHVRYRYRLDVCSSRLIFIDLAGSERAIDAQHNQRQTRIEGAQINSSLLALKECIRSMDLTQSHAPFRQSKLTHILRDSLVGSRTRTCLMANVTPADDCCQCSLNTLQYASRIRDISMRHRHRSMPSTKPKINRDDDVPLVKATTETRDKPQEKLFKPATASTPVHRSVSSVDHRTYLSTKHAGQHCHTHVCRDTSNETRSLPIDDHRRVCNDVTREECRSFVLSIGIHRYTFDSNVSLD
jgi:hypothetical protein